jgi:hypothetical protein
MFLPSLSTSAETFPCYLNSSRPEKPHLYNFAHFRDSPCLRRYVAPGWPHALCRARRVTLPSSTDDTTNTEHLTKLYAPPPHTPIHTSPYGASHFAVRLAAARKPSPHPSQPSGPFTPPPSPAAPENTPSNSPAISPLAMLAAAKPHRPRPTFSPHTAD